MGEGKPLIPPATAESMVAKRGTTTTNGAGDGSTVVDAGLTEANDYWNDMTLLILSGASDGQSRDITDFAGGTLTVSPVFANQILSGVRYFILPFKPSAAEVDDLKGTGFVKDTDSLVDLSHETDHAVPVEDAATDTQMRDVVGKKTDTTAGTSIVAISKQVKAKTDNIPASPAHAGEYDTEMARITADVATEAKQDVIDGYHDVPGEDAATDTQMRDVVGKKTDTTAGTSIVAISKQVKDKTDNLPGANVDVSGNITWVTATHGTNEGDISNLFSTDLTGDTRRRYAVLIDLTDVFADIGVWTTCTVRVKVDFGVGGAYRTVDLKEIVKADMAADKEPGVPIDVPATSKSVQITLQFNGALDANATIYYSYVKEALE